MMRDDELFAAPFTSDSAHREELCRRLHVQLPVLGRDRLGHPTLGRILDQLLEREKAS